MSNLDSFWHFYTFFCTFCYTSVGVEGLEELQPTNKVFWQDNLFLRHVGLLGSLLEETFCLSSLQTV